MRPDEQLRSSVAQTSALKTNSSTARAFMRRPPEGVGEGLWWCCDAPVGTTLIGVCDGPWWWCDLEAPWCDCDAPVWCDLDAPWCDLDAPVWCDLDAPVCDLDG